jgi:hypothetical protein
VDLNSAFLNEALTTLDQNKKLNGKGKIKAIQDGG